MGTTKKWGQNMESTYISTGCLRIDHNLGDTFYNVLFEINQAGIYATVEGKYDNYCIVYVRTFSGTLTNGNLTFWLVRAQ